MNPFPLVCNLCADTVAKWTLALLTPFRAIITATPLFIAVRAFSLCPQCVEVVIQAVCTDRRPVCKVIMPLEAQLITGATGHRLRRKMRAEKTLKGNKSVVELMTVGWKRRAAITVESILSLFHVDATVVVATDTTTIQLVGILHNILLRILGGSCHLAVDMIRIILITSACYSLITHSQFKFFNLNKNIFFFLSVFFLLLFIFTCMLLFNNSGGLRPLSYICGYRSTTSHSRRQSSCRHRHSKRYRAHLRADNLQDSSSHGNQYSRARYFPYHLRIADTKSKGCGIPCNN
jgi:hypothetical protein